MSGAPVIKPGGIIPVGAMDPWILQDHADIAFLAEVIWREARGESYEAKLAVGFSIMQRVKDHTWFGSDVMSVIFKKWQYSSMTAPHDPQLVNYPQAADFSWKDSLRAALSALRGVGTVPTAGADSYYDISIGAPAWATADKFKGQIGRLRFYQVQKDFEAEHLKGVIAAVSPHLNHTPNPSP